MRFNLALITNNWELKLTALALAVLFWALVQADSTTQVTVEDVPVTISMSDPGWVQVRPPEPQLATVLFSGPVRDMVRLAFEKPEIVVPVTNVTDSVEVRPLETAWVRRGGRLDRAGVEAVRPRSVRLYFQRIESRLVPVSVNLEGELPDGFRITGAVRVDPEAVRVSGARGQVERLESVPLNPIALDELEGPDTLRVAVDTAGLGLLVSPMRVTVSVPVAHQDSIAADTVLESDTARDTTSASAPAGT